MKTRRIKLPVTLTLFVNGIIVVLLLLVTVDDPWQHFRWSSVLIGIFIGLFITAFEIIHYYKKKQEVYKITKMLYYVPYLILFLDYFINSKGTKDFYDTQKAIAMCITFFTLAVCFKIYEFRSGKHGITFSDID